MIEKTDPTGISKTTIEHNLSLKPGDIAGLAFLPPLATVYSYLHHNFYPNRADTDASLRAGVFQILNPLFGYKNYMPHKSISPLTVLNSSPSSIADEYRNAGHLSRTNNSFQKNYAHRTIIFNISYAFTFSSKQQSLQQWKHALENMWSFNKNTIENKEAYAMGLAYGCHIYNMMRETGYLDAINNLFVINMTKINPMNLLNLNYLTSTTPIPELFQADLKTACSTFSFDSDNNPEQTKASTKRKRVEKTLPQQSTTIPALSSLYVPAAPTQSPILFYYMPITYNGDFMNSAPYADFRNSYISHAHETKSNHPVPRQDKGKELAIDSDNELESNDVSSEPEEESVNLLLQLSNNGNAFFKRKRVSTSSNVGNPSIVPTISSDSNVGNPSVVPTISSEQKAAIDLARTLHTMNRFQPVRNPQQAVVDESREEHEEYSVVPTL